MSTTEGHLIPVNWENGCYITICVNCKRLNNEVQSFLHDMSQICKDANSSPLKEEGKVPLNFINT